MQLNWELDMSLEHTETPAFYCLPLGYKCNSCISMQFEVYSMIPRRYMKILKEILLFVKNQIYYVIKK